MQLGISSFPVLNTYHFVTTPQRVISPLGQSPDLLLSSSLAGYCSRLFFRSRRCAVIIDTGFGLKSMEYKFYKSVIGICQEGHREFKVLRCSSECLVRKRVCSGRYTLNQHL